MDVLSGGAGDDVLFIDSEDNVANITGGAGYDTGVTVISVLTELARKQASWAR